MPEPISVLRCANCGLLDPGPRIVCPGCGSDRLAAHDVPGTGKLVTWTEIRRPPAGVDANGPYRVAVDALDAGVQVTGRLQGPAEPGAALICIQPGTPATFERARNG